MEQKPILTLPVAVVIAAVLIGGAIIYTTLGPSGRVVPRELNGEKTEVTAEENSPEKMLPVTAKDHIRGNLNAPVIIVEFSDTECPFCKNFHNTMKAVIEEFGPKNQVAWVYRHFPLTSLHPKAPKEAEATECAAEIGGEEVFWKYLDRIFEITPANNGLDPAELPRIAEFVGLNRSAFESCLSSGRHAEKVSAQTEDAINSGGTGTPYSVMILPNGERVVIPGAQPYAVVKGAITEALKAL